MKPKLHYHSDCSFFGGCENMIANFLNSEVLKKSYEISFTFRNTPEYLSGLENRVVEKVNQTGLNLFCWPSFLGKINQSFPSFIATPLKLLFFILQLKLIFLLLDTILIYFHIKNKDIDILHINNGGYPAATSANAAALAGKLCQIKNIIYVVNNIAEPYSKIDRWFDYPVDFFVKKSVTAFITGSDYAGAHLKETLNLCNEKHSKINNGVALRNITEDPNQVRERIGVPEKKLLIGVVANLEKRKGHIYLLKALVEMKLKGLELPYCAIEGSGETKKELLDFVENNDIKSHVIFIEKEKAVFNLINALDIFILPSIGNEDFPNVILEAMALGKPVIASRVAGIPEQIDAELSGIVVEPKDVIMLTDALEMLIIDTAKRLLYGENGKKKFNSIFTVSNSIEKYNKLYKSLGEGK